MCCGSGRLFGGQSPRISDDWVVAVDGSASESDRGGFVHYGGCGSRSLGCIEAVYFLHVLGD